MKISKISTVLFACFIPLVLTGFFTSCNDKKTPQEPPVVEEPAPEPVPPVVEEVPVKEEPKVEPPAPVVEEPAPVVAEPEPVIEEPAPEPVHEDDEYSRSVGNVSVSRDTFAEDKEAVLRIIAELAEIMKDSSSNRSYTAWLGYVEPASINYWKLRGNLQKAQKKLPVKGIVLKTLQDYFKHVFCPARRGREVTEIRYISDTYIKAVQVQTDKNMNDSVTVYYYFNKINGQWMVHLPTNEEFN